jgi:pimeloyl-ACP methyl ester carboxylesterase
MRRRASISAVAALLPVLLALICASWPASSAGSPGPSFTPCSDNQGFTCTTVGVPLDPSGQTPGTLALKVERQQAGAGTGAVGGGASSEAVLALAGGPGQAALPLAGFLAKALSPALSTRDLIVFDQRGTGQSAPLSCPALDSPGGAAGIGSVGRLFERCAVQLGPARAFYTTAASVADIEAVRQALGYEKLVLYGVSYGTKVALEYAAAHPQHVSALLLDSVEPPQGPEPFAQATFQAIGPVLSELCSAHACAGIASDPLAETARLAAQLHRRALRGAVYDGSGRRRRSSVSETDLLDILRAGDLNPALRALLPAAVRSALRGDPSPLLRLNLLAQGLIPTVPLPTPVEASNGIDDALNATTICEEAPFPWPRGSPASGHLTEAEAALGALPPSAFYPFDAGTALADGTIPGCLDWPTTAPSPPALGPLPNVPTLILSGGQDLRTPTSGARTIAAQIADAQLLVVPFTGHSVLGTDFSGCAETAIGAFFSGVAVQPCPHHTDIFTPTPVTPTRLDYVHPVPGLAGRPGRTLTVVLDTIVDLDRQVIGATLQANQALPAGSSFGGLHGGYARLGTSTLRLHHFTFVPGVELNGTFPVREGHLQTATIAIGGTAASPGRVRVGSGRRVMGTLGGRSFNIDITKVKLASAGGSDPEWLTAPLRFPRPGPIEGRPARLP